jgi:hypothetical protein
VFANLFGDGKQEIVVEANGYDAVKVVEPLHGTTIFQSGTCGPPSQCNPPLVEVLDVDADGADELLVATNSDLTCLGRVGTTSTAAPGTGSLDYKVGPVSPNPGNGTQTIRFELARRDHVVMEVLDILGRRIKTLLDAQLDGGAHSIAWDLRNDSGQRVPSGTYWCRLSSSGPPRTIQFVHVE